MTIFSGEWKEGGAYLRGGGIIYDNFFWRVEGRRRLFEGGAALFMTIFSGVEGRGRLFEGGGLNRGRPLIRGNMVVELKCRLASQKKENYSSLHV